MTTTTRTDQRPDVHEMVVVHRAFRREFPATVAMIRRTPDGDTRRAKVVADHLRLGLAGLHMHHTGEDEILWPLLLERAAPSTGLVETMQAQHHGVEASTAAITPALAAWEAAPTKAEGEQLARLIEQFTAALTEHLDLEEREILPLAARHLTVAEWITAVGAHDVDESLVGVVARLDERHEHVAGPGSLAAQSLADDDGRLERPTVRVSSCGHHRSPEPGADSVIHRGQACGLLIGALARVVQAGCRVDRDDGSIAVGFNTEYLGHLRITPRLNRAEVEWLSGFADWGALPTATPSGSR